MEHAAKAELGSGTEWQGVALEADGEGRRFSHPTSQLSWLHCPRLGTRHDEQQLLLSLWIETQQSRVGCSATELSSQLLACSQALSPGTGSHHAIGFRPCLLAVGDSADGFPMDPSSNAFVAVDRHFPISHFRDTANLQLEIREATFRDSVLCNCFCS